MSLSQPITVVIPARNESGTISKVVHECKKSDLVRSVIVVDNGSSDDTAALASAAGAKVISCHTPGFGAALKQGFLGADTHWVFKIDADIMNCTPDWIEKAWEISRKGSTLVSIQWDHDELYWALTYFLIRPFLGSGLIASR